jgi:hypothetical protein
MTDRDFRLEVIRRELRVAQQVLEEDIGQQQARQVAERLTYAAQQLRALAQEMDLEP